MATRRTPKPKPVKYLVATKLGRGGRTALEGEGFPRVSSEGVMMGEDELKAAQAAAEKCEVALIVTKEG